MSCSCKNKTNEYHPCQHGGECHCGGKCKNTNYSNVAGSLDDFKLEIVNVRKVVFQFVGGIAFAIMGVIIYSKLIKTI